MLDQLLTCGCTSSAYSISSMAMSSAAVGRSSGIMLKVLASMLMMPSLLAHLYFSVSEGYKRLNRAATSPHSSTIACRHRDHGVVYVQIIIFCGKGVDAPTTAYNFSWKTCTT